MALARRPKHGSTIEHQAIKPVENISSGNGVAGSVQGIVSEPGLHETISLLRELISRVESKYGVEILHANDNDKINNLGNTLATPLEIAKLNNGIHSLGVDIVSYYLGIVRIFGEGYQGNNLRDNYCKPILNSKLDSKEAKLLEDITKLLGISYGEFLTNYGVKNPETNFLEELMIRDGGILGNKINSIFNSLRALKNFLPEEISSIIPEDTNILIGDKFGINILLNIFIKLSEYKIKIFDDEVLKGIITILSFTLVLGHIISSLIKGNGEFLGNDNRFEELSLEALLEKDYSKIKGFFDSNKLFEICILKIEQIKLSREIIGTLPNQNELGANVLSNFSGIEISPAQYIKFTNAGFKELLESIEDKERQLFLIHIIFSNLDSFCNDSGKELVGILSKVDESRFTLIYGLFGKKLKIEELKIIIENNLEGIVNTLDDKNISFFIKIFLLGVNVSYLEGLSNDELNFLSEQEIEAIDSFQFFYKILRKNRHGIENLVANSNARKKVIQDLKGLNQGSLLYIDLKSYVDSEDFFLERNEIVLNELRRIYSSHKIEAKKSESDTIIESLPEEIQGVTEEITMLLNKEEQDEFLMWIDGKITKESLQKVLDILNLIRKITILVPIGVILENFEKIDITMLNTYIENSIKNNEIEKIKQNVIVYLSTCDISYLN